MTTFTKEDLKKKEILKKISPIIDYIVDMIMAGVLKKNIIKHFTNKGFPFDTSLNLFEVAEVRAKNKGLI